MAEHKKRKRRAYLDSFQKDSNGKYVYKGDFYQFEPQGTGLRQEMTRLWVLTGAMMAALIAAGCVDGPGTGNCFYVLMPFVINVIAGVSVCWGLARMTKGGSPMRSYVYQETADQLPARAVFSAICAGTAIVGEVVYLFRNGMEGKLAGCLIFLFMEAFALAAALLIRKQISEMKWKKIPFKEA